MNKCYWHDFFLISDKKQLNEIVQLEYKLYAPWWTNNVKTSFAHISVLSV